MPTVALEDPELQPLITTTRSTPNAPISPLLPSDRQYIDSLRNSEDFIACHIYKIHGDETWVFRLRQVLQHWLASKWGHYFVIVLVAANISCIIADFMVRLQICEFGGMDGFDLHGWQSASYVLTSTSLVFSCLFMAELLGTIFAFGFRYFTSIFHTFDAVIILSAFILNLVLRTGPLQELGSCVLVLRMWRIIKIIEEFSEAGVDRLAELQHKVDVLTREKEEVLKKNEELRMRLGDDEFEHADGDMDGHADGHADGHMGGHAGNGRLHDGEAR